MAAERLVLCLLLSRLLSGAEVGWRRISNKLTKQKNESNRKRKMNIESQNINLSSLPTGMYVIRILDGEREVQKQMLEIIK